MTRTPEPPDDLDLPRRTLDSYSAPMPPPGFADRLLARLTAEGLPAHADPDAAADPDTIQLPPSLLGRHDRQLLKSGFRSIHRLLEFTADSQWLTHV